MTTFEGSETFQDRGGMDQSQLVIAAPSLRSGTCSLQEENVRTEKRSPPELSLGAVHVQGDGRAKYFPRNQCYAANCWEDTVSSLETSCEIWNLSRGLLGT